MFKLKQHINELYIHFCMNCDVLFAHDTCMLYIILIVYVRSEHEEYTYAIHSNRKTVILQIFQTGGCQSLSCTVWFDREHINEHSCIDLDVLFKHDSDYVVIMIIHVQSGKEEYTNVIYLSL